MGGASRILIGVSVLLSSGAIRPAHPQADPPPVVRGLVVGQVLDAVTGGALAGARVTLRALPEGVTGLPGVRDTTDSGSGVVRLTRIATTEGDGVYRFTGLPDGRFELRVRRLGYRPAALTVDLAAAATLSMSVGLTVLPIRLEPVRGAVPPLPPIQQTRDQLSAPDSARAAAVHRRQREGLEPDLRTLTTADLTEAVSLGDPDLFRALTALPGVNAPAVQGAEFWVRGAPFEHVSVRWDGLPLYNAITGRGEAAAVTPNGLGGAFLYAGSRPASVAGGGAALVDLRTRPASGTGDVRGVYEGAGFWGHLGVEQRAAEGRFGWMLGLRRQMVFPGGSTDLSARFDIALDDDKVLDIGGISLWDQQTALCCINSNLASWRNQAGRIAYQAPLAGWDGTHFVGGTGYLSDVVEVLNENSPSFTPEPQPATDIGIRYLTLGSHFSRLDTDAVGSGWRLGYAFTAERVRYRGPIPLSSPATTPSATVVWSGALHYGTAWAERRLALPHGIEIDIGFRADAGGSVRDAGRVRFAPRAAVRFGPRPDLSLSASAGRSYRYTQGIGETGNVTATPLGGNRRLTRVWALAGDEIPAARTDILSAGAEWWPGPTWLASVSAFTRRTTGLAVSDPRPAPLNTQRPYVLGADRASGFEISLRRMVGRWTGALGYSHVVARRRADGLDYPGPADVRHVVDASALWRVSRPFRFGASVLAAAGAPVTRVQVCDSTVETCPPGWNRVGEPGALRMPSITRLNLFGEWTKRFSAWDLNLFVRWNDVLGPNRDWTYLGTVPGCDVRFSTPCPPDRVSTDRLFTSRIADRIAMGARVAF